MSENNNAPVQELSEILQVRRDKLSAMKESGNDPFVKTKYDDNSCFVTKLMNK